MIKIASAIQLTMSRTASAIKIQRTILFPRNPRLKKDLILNFRLVIFLVFLSLFFFTGAKNLCVQLLNAFQIPLLAVLASPFSKGGASELFFRKYFSYFKPFNFNFINDLAMRIFNKIKYKAIHHINTVF